MTTWIISRDAGVRFVRGDPATWLALAISLMALAIFVPFAIWETFAWVWDLAMEPFESETTNKPVMKESSS